jgi:YD repeat-containing protein
MARSVQRALEQPRRKPETLRRSFSRGLVIILLASIPRPLHATTVTTKYQYNADGALTAITKQAADGSTTTTYLVWDDLKPETNDPTTGTVSVGNGRLIGFGTSPANLTTAFQLDVRDRLMSVSGTNGSETYDYNAGGMMSSPSTGSDSFLFFYDHNKDPQVTNVRQSSSGLLSGYLDHVRYLGDGTEQVLLKPRKDMACTSDAQAQALQSYAYNAYGASPGFRSSVKRTRRPPTAPPWCSPSPCVLSARRSSAASER